MLFPNYTNDCPTAILATMSVQKLRLLYKMNLR
jgi:hypothetical protein